MKRKRHTLKRNRNTVRRKATVQSFSLRDAWDVIVVIMLLIIIVYFSNYVRNNHHFITAWPVIGYVNITGNVDSVDHEALKVIIRNHSIVGFLRLQIEQLEKAIEELTWVHQASVQRYWPDTLSVKISQHSPIARWGNTGLMSSHGDLFFPEDLKPYQNLPILYGEEERAKELARTFESSIRELKPLGLRLRGLFEDERQSKHLVLSDGLVISIGDGDIKEKLNRFIVAYKQYLAANLSEVKKIDLRYTNGLAVEWKSPQFAQNIGQHLGKEANL